MPEFRLMNAGPVQCDPRVLAAIGEQTLPHYGEEFMAVFTEATALLKRLYETDGEVIMIPGPGTAAMDGAVGSLVPRGDSVCVLDNGFFSFRFGQIVEAHGLRTWTLKAPWGRHIDPDDLRAFLTDAVPRASAEGQPMRALVLVHHETSTGVLNPLKEIAAVAKEFDLAVIVDAVASFGGVPIPAEKWGIDVCVGVPNKCLAAPPGAGLTYVSPLAWEMAAKNPTGHGWYLNLSTWRYYIDEWADWHPYPTTMPTNNLKAIREALRIVFERGMEAHFAMFRTISAEVRAGMAEMGFSLYPEADYAAPIISALNARPEFPIEELLGYLHHEHGLMLSGGLVELKGKIFRVGHMGAGATDPGATDLLLDATRAFMQGKGLI